MVQTSDRQAPVDSKVTVDFIASSMKLVNLLTPQLGLSDLESVSAVLEQALMIVEHAAGALEYNASSEWTRVQKEERLPSSPSTLPSSSPPRSSPAPTFPTAPSLVRPLPLHSSFSSSALSSTPTQSSSTALSESATGSVSSPVLPSGLTPLLVSEARSIMEMLDNMTPTGKSVFHFLIRN
jgi:hypothetical protein